MTPYNTFFTLFILLLTISSNNLFAQDESPADESKAKITAEALLLESKTLLAEIDKLSKKTTALRAHIKKSPAVDRFLFFSLITTLEESLRSKLDRLVEIKMQLGKDNAYPDLYRRPLQTIILKQSAILQQEIKTVSGIVTKMRTRESKQDALQYTLHRAEIKIDSLFTEWQKNIQRGNAVKLDMQEDTDKLNQLIQFRAIGLTGRIRLMLDAITVLNDRLDNATEEQQKQIKQKLYELEISKTETALNLENMVGLMKKQGMETTEFGKVLVVATGEILNENVNTQAVVGIFQTTVNNAMAWLNENFPLIIFKLIVFILILLAFKILADITGRFVNRVTKTSGHHTSQLLNNFFRSIASKSVMLIGFVIALSQLGIEIGPLLAGMGVMGFVVGFAMQDTLSNFASGMMILVYRPYDVGDFVQVSGISGQVKEMNLVSTTILTIDHQRMAIPNSKIWGDIITNVTAERIRRIDFVFRIGYADSLEKAENILDKILNNHELVLDDPEPLIKVHKLGESSVEIIVRPWVNSKDYWNVYWDITRQVKEDFDKAGISIPFPQQDVHVYSAQMNT